MDKKCNRLFGPFLTQRTSRVCRMVIINYFLKVSRTLCISLVQRNIHCKYRLLSPQWENIYSKRARMTDVCFLKRQTQYRWGMCNYASQVTGSPISRQFTPSRGKNRASFPNQSSLYRLQYSNSVEECAAIVCSQ